MERDHAAYIVRYYSRFMTPKEHLTNRHLFGTMKLSHGRSDPAAQSEARIRASGGLRTELFSDDPEVLSSASNGYDAFVMLVAERIFEKHREQISFNYCPKCGKLANTPKAKQCRFCYHDWHTPDG